MAEYPAKITQALHAVMDKVGYVQKRGRNKFHQYNYAGEADLLEALRPAMLEAGLLLIPSGQEHSPIDEYGNTRVSVAYTLAHKDGDVWPEKIIAFGCGNDKNSKGGVQDKGTYKALTGANKYLLFKLFQIETGDDPEKTEAEAPAPQPPVAMGPLTKTQLEKKLRVFAGELLNVEDSGQLAGLQNTYESELKQCKEQHPVWWLGSSDQPGLQTRIFKLAQKFAQQEQNPLEGG